MEAVLAAWLTRATDLVSRVKKLPTRSLEKSTRLNQVGNRVINITYHSFAEASTRSNNTVKPKTNHSFKGLEIIMRHTVFLA